MRAETIGRLHAECTRIQSRLDAMYVDKLDGVVDSAFFDRKAADWRAEQSRLLEAIAGHKNANQGYLDEGIQLLQLARRALELFERQEPLERRRLLDFVLSNSTWKNGELTAEIPPTL